MGENIFIRRQLVEILAVGQVDLVRDAVALEELEASLR